MIAAKTSMPSSNGATSLRVSAIQPTLSAVAAATRHTPKMTKKVIVPRRPGTTAMGTDSLSLGCFFDGLVDARLADVRGQAEEFEGADVEVGQVDFVPREAVRG